MSNDTLTLVNEANNALSIVSPVVINILTAVLVLFIGFVIGKIFQRIILKIFEISDLDKITKKHIGLKFKLSVIISTIALYFVYIVAIVMALNRLGITTTVVTTITIILVVVLALFIIFGLNDMFANLFAGIIIKLRGNIKAGDYVRIKGKHIEGYIISMNTLNLRLETIKDEIVFIPNMAFFKSEIIKPKIHKHLKKRK